MRPLEVAAVVDSLVPVGLGYPEEHPLADCLRDLRYRVFMPPTAGRKEAPARRKGELGAWRCSFGRTRPGARPTTTPWWSDRTPGDKKEVASAYLPLIRRLAGHPSANT